MDGVASWPQIVFIAGIIGGTAIFVGGALWWFWTKLDITRRDFTDKVDLLRQTFDIRLTEIQSAVHRIEVEIAKNYVVKDDLHHLRQELSQDVRDLHHSFDERMDKLQRNGGRS